VVVGLGFVGAVMAAVVADSTDEQGASGSSSSACSGRARAAFGRSRCSTAGISPVKAEDPNVELLISRCVKEKKTLVATYTEEALKLADVVVVDVCSATT